MPVSLGGVRIGQLLSAPLSVAKAALGVDKSNDFRRSGGSGSRGVPLIRTKVAGKVKSMRTARSGRVKTVGAMKHMKKAGGGGRSGGFGAVKSYTKHTSSGRVVQVKGYKRPYKKR
jgi:hypothetical protein